MAPQTWSEWLRGLLASLRPPPVPGSHEATLEQFRAGALLNKELRRPAGQRDEELVWKLHINYRTIQLKNTQAKLHEFQDGAARFEASTRQCCSAASWAAQRVAASCRAMADFKEQEIVQLTEELAAAQARRQAVIAAQPTLRLQLPEALQQVPPRLDWCSECAQMVQQMEQAEESCRLYGDALRDKMQQRGMHAAPDAAAASAAASAAAAAAAPAAAAPAAPAADPPAGEGQLAQGAPSQQQQQQQQPPAQQQQQQQEECSSGGGTDSAEGAPTTPKQPLQPPQQQQQHSSSDQEQRHSSSDQEQRHPPSDEEQQ